MRYLICLLLLVTGCARQQFVEHGDPDASIYPDLMTAYSPLGTTTYVMDPYFDSWVARFKTEYSKHNSDTLGDVKVSFGDTGSHGSRVIGYCDVTAKAVVISQAFWNSNPTITNESLLYHELGHCLMHRAHQADLRPDRDLWPVSLMSPYIVKADQYGVDYDYYLTELFTVKLPQLDMSNYSGTSGSNVEMKETGHGCDAHLK